MRVAIPNQLQPRHVAIFICILFLGQGIEGTNFLFMVLTSVFIALWATAFNTAGGLAYPSGAFIFANGLTSVVIGLGAKVLLVERGERNLKAPILTMICYCTSMVMLLLVAFLVRALRPREALVKEFASLEAMNTGSIICLVAGLLLPLLGAQGHNAGGSLLSALRQINEFPGMAIVLATTYTVRSTNGRRSTNWVVFASIGIGIFFAIVYFGKGSFLMPFLLWAVAASVQGYSFKRNQLIGLALGAAFFSYYFVPYSQYVRNQGSESGTVRDNIPIAIAYLSDLNRTRELYYAALAEIDLGDEAHLYDQREGFLDRLVNFATDDALIDYTAHGHVFGLSPMYAEFANLVPRFLWKNKPLLNSGNEYGHELGWTADEDDTTGISFSAAAEGFHDATWLGLLLVLPCVTFLLFMVFDTLAGNARNLSFALVPVVDLFWAGMAGGIPGLIHIATYGAFGFLFIVWVSKTAGPFILGNLLQRQSSFRQAAPVRGRHPIPGHLDSPPSSSSA